MELSTLRSVIHQRMACEVEHSHPRFPVSSMGALLLVACLGFFAGCSEVKSQQPKAKEALPVSVSTVKEKPVPVQLRTIGRVEAYATVAIKTRVGGEITRVHFQDGQEVNRGDLLFTIDPRPYEAALAEAQAKLLRDSALAKNAENDARRYETLFEKNYVSRTQYELARANADALKATIEADRAAVENARLQLSYCFIHAPISGRTGSVLADLGNMIKANADDAMLVINQIQPIYVSFSVAERHLSQIKKYMTLRELSVDALIPGEEEHPVAGVLTFVDNTVDKASGTIALKATFANQEKRLWPGLFVNVVVTLTTQPHAIVVPAHTVQTGQQGQYVFIVKPDLTVESRPVIVGSQLDREALVDSGLQAGEMVVTEGQLRLAPGARVEIKDTDQPGENTR
jgi:membrane fusion protein, multidrug efflux system